MDKIMEILNQIIKTNEDVNVIIKELELIDDKYTRELVYHILELEQEKFKIDMQDHWNTSDYIASNKLNNEIIELKLKLKDRCKEV